MKIRFIAAAAAAALTGITGLAASTGTAGAAEAPGHLILHGGPDALYTTGAPGSVVRFGRYRASNHGEDFNADHFANAYGAGAFYWAPGGAQTNDYLKVTTSGATLVSGAPHATIFAPIAHGAYTVFATLSGGKPSKNVLTDVGGHAVIAKEGATPSSSQLWKV